MLRLSIYVKKKEEISNIFAIGIKVNNYINGLTRKNSIKIFIYKIQ
jgi:hypothetical protein